MKKPDLKEFEETAEVCKGNITAIAKALSVNRSTVHTWTKENEEYKDIIENFKGAFLDEC